MNRILKWLFRRDRPRTVPPGGEHEYGWKIMEGPNYLCELQFVGYIDAHFGHDFKIVDPQLGLEELHSKLRIPLRDSLNVLRFESLITGEVVEGCHFCGGVEGEIVSIRDNRREFRTLPVKEGFVDRRER